MIAERPDAVQIMGSFTQNVACNMIEISLFNILLDKYELNTAFGPKAETLLDEIINAANGAENKVRETIKKNDGTDSYSRLYKNLPFPTEHCTMLGITSSSELKMDEPI